MDFWIPQVEYNLTISGTPRPTIQGATNFPLPASRTTSYGNKPTATKKTKTKFSTCKLHPYSSHSNTDCKMQQSESSSKSGSSAAPFSSH
jgi:hypothetical protein